MGARPDLWVKLAYFDLTGGSGPAALFVFFWDADFDITPNPVEVDIWNNYMLFSGASRSRDFGAPGTTTGQISCAFAPWLSLPSGSGDYVIHVELWGYGPWQGGYDSEPEEPKVAFFIDGIPLGERLLPHDWVDTVLYVRLVDGRPLRPTVHRHTRQQQHQPPNNPATHQTQAPRNPVGLKPARPPTQCTSKLTRPPSLTNSHQQDVALTA